MKWKFAAKPHPKISKVWSDEFWPPQEFYDLPDRAIGEIELLWLWDNPKTAKQVSSKITEEQLLLWATINIVGQICNGGFSKALFNSYGELAEEAIIGLHRFGLSDFADLVDEAWNAFGMRPIPKDREVRIQHLEAKANMNPDSRKDLEFIEHASALFQATHKTWDELEKEFYGKLNAKTHGDGYNASFYKPLAEWIYENKDRFFYKPGLLNRFKL